jgi:hypothetical protein
MKTINNRGNHGASRVRAANQLKQAKFGPGVVRRFWLKTPKIRLENRRRQSDYGLHQWLFIDASGGISNHL